MYIFNNVEEFRNNFFFNENYKPVLESIDNIHKINMDIYQSISDKLVFRRTKNNIIYDEKEFEGHKRYFDIQYILDGETYIEIANKKDLIIVTDYDDIKDIEFYKGKGNVYTLKKGNIIIISNDEAFRFLNKEVEKLIIKFTIENY